MKGKVVVGVFGIAAVLGLIAGTAFPPRSAVGQSQSPMHVVYFASALASGGQMSPAAIMAQMAAQFPAVTYEQLASWSGVLASHATDQIDVLVVDSGSIGSIDPAWIQDQYFSHALAVMGVNVPMQALATITNDPITTHGSLAFSVGSRERYSKLQMALKGDSTYMALALSNLEAALDGSLDYPESARGFYQYSKGVIYVDRDGVKPFYSSIGNALSLKQYFESWQLTGRHIFHPSMTHPRT